MYVNIITWYHSQDRTNNRKVRFTLNEGPQGTWSNIEIEARRLDARAIKLNLPDKGAVLEFDPTNQTLTSVQLNLPQSQHEIGLSIHGQDISRPDCRRILSVLPPTTIGTFDRKNLAYTIRFKSGIEFRMRCDTESRFEEFLKHNEHPIGSRDYSPNVDRIIVSAESREALDSYPRFDIYPQEGVLFFSATSGDPMWIRLGNNIQIVLSVLGPPDEICGSFYNYFDHGVDIKLDSKSNVDKIIFHFNQPGHDLFGRYKRCSIRFKSVRSVRTKPPKSDDKDYNESEISLENLKSLFGAPGEPLVVNCADWPSVKYYFSFNNGIIGEFTAKQAPASLEVGV